MKENLFWTMVAVSRAVFKSVLKVFFYYFYLPINYCKSLYFEILYKIKRS